MPRPVEAGIPIMVLLRGGQSCVGTVSEFDATKFAKYEWMAIDSPISTFLIRVADIVRIEVRNATA
jgi:hypothetical protein